MITNEMIITCVEKEGESVATEMIRKQAHPALEQMFGKNHAAEMAQTAVAVAMGRL